MAPGTSAMSCAEVPLDGFQAVIAPASDENRKNAGDSADREAGAAVEHHTGRCALGDGDHERHDRRSGFALVAPR